MGDTVNSFPVIQIDYIYWKEKAPSTSMTCFLNMVSFILQHVDGYIIIKVRYTPPFLYIGITLISQI